MSATRLGDAQQHDRVSHTAPDTMQSWLDIPADSHFSLANIPFAIISHSGSSGARVGATRLGDWAVDLSVLEAAGLLAEAFEQTETSYFAKVGASVLVRPLRCVLMSLFTLTAHAQRLCWPPCDDPPKRAPRDPVPLRLDLNASRRLAYSRRSSARLGSNAPALPHSGLCRLLHLPRSCAGRRSRNLWPGDADASGVERPSDGLQRPRRHRQRQGRDRASARPDEGVHCHARSRRRTLPGPGLGIRDRASRLHSFPQ